MLKDYFVDDLKIVTVNFLPNGFGGLKEFWDDITWAEADFSWQDANINWVNSIIVKGLIDLQTGTEKNIGDKYITDSTHIMFTDITVPINHTQQVIKNNEIYRVLYVDAPFNRHKEVYLQKVGVDNA